MKVTIVGAGNMGRGIGTRAVAGGHEVEIVDRDAEQARTLAEELGGSATALGPNDPLSGEVVVSPSTTPRSRTPSTSTPTGSRARSSSTSRTRSIPRQGTTSPHRPERPPPRRSLGSSRMERPS